MSETLLNHVHAHPPRCVSGLALRKGKQQGGNEPIVVSFKLSSASNESTARLQGYLLSRVNANYKGKPQFVSPVYLQWLPSEAIDTLFDSKTDGYHAESGSSANVRGSGNPDHWKCPNCNEEIFHVEVKFDYYGGAHDLWEDEPELAIENYFNGIRIFAECVGCSEVSQLLGMDV